ncbi:MAG TPA: hypothetical protein VM715_09795 [Candidatus Acidoferrum sp.]|nr:hypothetical protein [Candidatus Acidoferrum sp.]
MLRLPKSKLDNLPFCRTMLPMHGEQKENIAKFMPQPTEAPAAPALSDPSIRGRAQTVKLLLKELDAEMAEELPLEDVDATDAELEALSDEALQEQIDLLEERRELAERQKELDRRAINLGLLKLADQALRCSHVKANGKPCRAPALGGRLFCVFHGRALETQDNPLIKVAVLEDRESLQLTVKQIMEQIVSGRIEPQNASLLLRAVQIANSTLKSSRARAPRRKPAHSEAYKFWGDPEEKSG